MQSRRVVSTISYRPNNYSAVLSQPRWHCQWHPFIRPNCLKSKIQFVETQGFQKLEPVFCRAFTVSRLAWYELCGQMEQYWIYLVHLCIFLCICAFLDQKSSPNWILDPHRLWCCNALAFRLLFGQSIGSNQNVLAPGFWDLLTLLQTNSDIVPPKCPPLCPLVSPNPPGCNL